MTAEQQTIEERVKESVARVFRKKASDITLQTRFVEDLYAKSINIVELVAFLEYGFDIDIPRAQARQAKTVGEAIRLVESLVNKRSNG